MTTLYEKLGGEPAVDAAVEIFYKRVMMDDSIKHFFYKVDMEVQKEKQKCFLTLVFGGPNNYTGRDMRESHRWMNLTEVNFNAIIGHLKATMEELNMDSLLVEEVIAVTESFHDDVLDL